MFIRLILVASLWTHLQVFAEDEPDLKKEQRLYQIYKEYNETPTSDQSWQTALKSSPSQNYLIQKGDTLWDVSNTLFADPNFWPKIWSLNSSDIFNPHEISPSNEIIFVPGSLGEPPRVSVQAKSEVKKTVEEETTPEKKEELSYELPPPSRKLIPLSKLPESLPNWNYSKDKKTKIIFEDGQRIRNFGSPDTAMDYFISDTLPNYEGEIVETEMGMKTAAEYQYVHVKMKSTTPSQDMLVLTDIGEVEDKYNDRRANLIQVQGVVQILEQISAEENIYRALVS